MLDLNLLRERVQRNECTNLYWGVRGLDRRIPVSDEITSVFVQMARTIERIFPDRVSGPAGNPIDARIVVIDFCENAATTQNDILQVLEASIDWLAADEYTA